MKICSPQVGLKPNSTLGGEVYDNIILWGLADRGHEIDIILPKNAPHAGHDGWHIHRVALSRGLRWPVSNTLFSRAIGTVYKKRPFDILRIHSLLFTGAAAVHAKNVFSLTTPLIAHHHHIEQHSVRSRVERSVARACDLIITPSKHARDTVQDMFGLPEGKVVHVYNGVDEDARPEQKDKKLFKQYELRGKIVLLFVGTMTQRKQPFVLLDVLQALTPKYSNIVLLVRGDGPLKREFELRVTHMGLSHFVRYLPPYAPKERVKVLNLADVFVFPSKYEGFGLAPAEAMACGKPVVAFHAASLPEIIDNGVTGFLAPLSQQSKYIERVGELIADERLRKRMGGAAHKEIKARFNWEKTIKEMEKTYLSALR